MLSTLHVRRRFHLTAMLALLALGAAACGDDDETGPEEEPEVQTLTLAVGASTVTVNRTSGAFSGPLLVPAGASQVTAQWRRADGSNETLITSDEFDLRIVPTNAASATWTANGAFGGTLTVTGLNAGQTTTAQVSLFHKEEQHEDFGPYTLTIQRQ
jgi:hypothetical protein